MIGCNNKECDIYVCINIILSQNLVFIVWIKEMVFIFNFRFIINILIYCIEFYFIYLYIIGIVYVCFKNIFSNIMKLGGN